MTSNLVNQPVCGGLENVNTRIEEVNVGYFVIKEDDTCVINDNGLPDAVS